MKIRNEDQTNLRNMSLVLMIVMLVCLGCSTIRREVDRVKQPAGNDPGYSNNQPTQLTTQNAQKAVDSFVINDNGKDCEGDSCLNIVGGVRELPGQNLAVAELRFEGFIYEAKDGQQRIFRNEKGQATFTKYSDRGWVLTKINTGDAMFGGIYWTTDIEVR